MVQGSFTRRATEETTVVCMSSLPTMSTLIPPPPSTLAFRPLDVEAKGIEVLDEKLSSRVGARAVFALAMAVHDLGSTLPRRRSSREANPGGIGGAVRSQAHTSSYRADARRTEPSTERLMGG